MGRESSYDRVPYPSMSYAQTHPDRLATLATLLGMAPAAIDRCRVLEVGCASGGNLIPMAYGLPGSEFVGIDNSARQIGEGQRAIEMLGLRNVRLACADIVAVDAGLGQFDYIIAHGVFSWVPRAVQEKLLELCSEHLDPRGVAYVSYNTYPGWHLFGMIREMMLYHTRALADPEARATEARALLDFLAGALPAEASPYGSFLNMYAQLLQGELKGADERGNAFLLHDELEEVNEPVYFYQFVERAARYGLQYLGEAEFRTMVGGEFGSQVAQALDRIAKSVIDLEQYMDFLRNRTLRQTALCHRDATPDRKISPDRVRALCASSRAQPISPDLDPHAAEVAQFRGADGAILSTDHPVTKAAMLCLAEVWPQTVPFERLLSMARARLGKPEQGNRDIEEDAQVLATNLLQAYGYSGSLVELHTRAPQLVLEAGEWPVASPVVRLQAQSSDRVTNLCHERVSVDEVDRFLLSHLDGAHDRAALVDSLLAGPVAEGVLQIHDEGQPVEDVNVAAEILSEDVDRRLAWLARAALLTA